MDFFTNNEYSYDDNFSNIFLNREISTEFIYVFWIGILLDFLTI